VSETEISQKILRISAAARNTRHVLIGDGSPACLIFGLKLPVVSSDKSVRHFLRLHNLQSPARTGTDHDGLSSLDLADQ
jgi:hypothetical protein